jgi:hypothetical protein
MRITLFQEALLSLLVPYLQVLALVNDVTRPTDASGESSASSSCAACSIFLAPSTIPNAGLGIFSAVSHKGGDIIDTTNDIVINYAIYGEDYEPELEEAGGQLQHYSWTKNIASDHVMMQQSEGDHHVEMVPGFGAFPNHHSYYNNYFINAREGALAIDRYEFSRPHPGTDAYTPFHAIRVEALDDMPAGSEFFADYGPNYFISRGGFYQEVPLMENYEEASDLMSKFANVAFAKSHPSGKTFTPEIVEDIWSVIANKAAHKRTKTALWKDVQKVLDNHEEDYLPEITTRSNEWLQQNGVCIDNVKSGASSIHEAGRGAFARRPIAAGEIIAPNPVLQLNRTKQIHEERTNPDERLLINYCFGHANSTMMLCPYVTGVAVINHNSVDTNTPNAEVRLSNHTFFNRDLLDKSAHTIMESLVMIGIVFDIVATRDIEAGEEIFLNYGQAWQDAWDAHQEQWDEYVSPIKCDEIKPLLQCTVQYEGDSGSHELPSCLKEAPQMNRSDEASYKYNTACFYYPSRPDSSEHANSQDNDAESPTVLPWSYESSDGKGTTGGLFPCHILARQTTSSSPVGVLVNDDDSTTLTLFTAMIEAEGKSILAKNIPATAIRSVTDKWRAINNERQQYMNDESIPEPFRHPIMLPDDVFPSSWMDLNFL